MKLKLIGNEGTEPGDHYGKYFKDRFVHRDLYVDEDLFAVEVEALFSSTWVYVAHESELLNVGDFVSRRIGRRPVIVTLDDDGQLNVLLNRCPHRGATVCRSPRGNTTHFACPYHAWSFALDGKSRAIPMRPGYAGAEDQEFDLVSVAQVEVYRGFIFASLRPIQPLIDHLAGAAMMLDQWIDRNPGMTLNVRAGTMPFDIRANWKCVYDNAADGYHVPFSHESMLTVLQNKYGDVDIAYYAGNFDQSPLFVKDLGNGHTLLDQRASMHAGSAWVRQHVLPGREALWASLNEQYGEERALELLDQSTGSGMNLNIFPNLLLIGNQIQVLDPVTVNRTHVHWYSTSLRDAPPEINAIRMRMQEDFPSFGEVDDAANFEACQSGMEDVPEVEWINIGRHAETDLGHLDKDGLWREPVSSDLHPRAYWTAWRTIMNDAAARGDAR